MVESGLRNLVHSNLVTRLDPLLRPEPARVVLRPFIPAENGSGTGPQPESRVGRIQARVLDLGTSELRAELDCAVTSLAGRHRDVERLLKRRFYDMGDRFVREGR